MVKIDINNKILQVVIHIVPKIIGNKHGIRISVLKEQSDNFQREKNHIMINNFYCWLDYSHPKLLAQVQGLYSANIFCVYVGIFLLTFRQPDMIDIQCSDSICHESIVQGSW